MFDCWKNSCHGATVVPTMAMMSRTEVEVTPPWIPGMNSPCTNGPGRGWEKTTSGMTKKFAATKMSMNRSQRRKLPVAVIAISARAAIGTETYGETPK